MSAPIWRCSSVIEALAECHDLTVGFAFGIEIASALAAADRKTGEGVLEDLFEAEEFDDAQVYRRMETKAALIRTDGAVELYAVSVVNLYLTLVVYPGHAEHNDPFRSREALQKSISSVLFLICFDHDTKGFQDFLYSLKEFRLIRILFLYSCQSFINI